MKVAAAISVDELTDHGADWAPFQALVARFRAWGYDGLELAVRDPARLDVTTLERALRAGGLPVVALATGSACTIDGLSYTDPDPALRRAAARRIADHCALAARIGGLVILGLIRGRIAPGMPADRAMAWTREGVQAGCEAGLRLGVRLVFEPINRYEADLIHTAAEGLAFIEEIGAPNLGLLLDTFHMNIEEPDMCQALRQAGPRLHHVHTADSNRCYPGAGHIDFAAVVATLRALGYRGCLSAEILPRPDLIAGLARAAEHLRGLLGR